MVKKVSKKSTRKSTSAKSGAAAASAKGGVKVQSASQLGIMATKLGVKQKAKTHKGRKILQAREPKVQENPKRCIIMKGRKSS